MDSTDKRKRHALNEKERQKIRKRKQDNPLLGQRDLAQWATREFGRRINQPMIQRTLSSKYAFLDDKTFAPGFVGNSRVFQADHPLLEQALFEWVVRMEGSVPVSGDMIQTAAHQLWEKMEDFQHLKEPKWSDKWLHDFKARHKIRKFRQHGEAGSVNKQGAAERLKACQTIVRDYPLDDIYNCDETGLFWLLVPDITLATKMWAGKKKKKDRITILVTVNANGSHKLNHWILGHAKNPRCFGKNNSKIENLQMQWRSNKKAWMTAVIFMDFLGWFDKQIREKKPGKSVLLLMDSFSAHESGVRQLLDTDKQLPWPQRYLQQTRVEFLPKNATSLYQPLDQGIISNLKLYYRKRWLQFMVTCTLTDKDPIKEMTVLRACQWIVDVWMHEVTADTISNCWVKSKLLGEQYGPEQKPKDWDQQQHEVEGLVEELQNAGRIRDRMDVSDFLNPVEETVEDSPEDLLDHVAETFTEIEIESEGNGNPEQHDLPPISIDQALQAFDIVLRYEEDLDIPNVQLQTFLRRRLKEVTDNKLRDRIDKAQQQSLYSYFMSF